MSRAEADRRETANAYVKAASGQKTFNLNGDHSYSLLGARGGRFLPRHVHRAHAAERDQRSHGRGADLELGEHQLRRLRALQQRRRGRPDIRDLRYHARRRRSGGRTRDRARDLPALPHDRRRRDGNAQRVMEHAIQTEYLRWIVLLPLIGAAVNGLLGAQLQKRLGKWSISVVACIPVVLAFCISVAAFLKLKALAPEERFLIDHVYSWLHVGSLNVDVSFWVDPLSAVMILVVTGIGGLIHIYSTGYMHDDKSYWRFFAFLNLFTFSMLLLVLADSMLLMFIGWEGVGLCSYALIGFWYHDHVNTRAGNKAFIVNRVGDFGFILGIFLIFWTLDAQGHATLAFREITKNAALLQGQMLWGMPVATLATLFLFLGATGKSAQIPLYVWLPDAMQGPTPVSALIHAATMVTAGVYMIARLSAVFSLAPETLHVVASIGAATALMAATIALTQNDIKRVLAYSTISQLGYMFLAAGVAAYAAGVFHLMTHAFFKACLFLGSGSVIHAMGGEQDMRKMGGLKKYMPWTFWTFTFSVLAIPGVPGLAGFFSKDEIL